MNSTVSDRIALFARRAQRDRDHFEPPTAPPDEQRAMRYLRDGVGQVVLLYIEARTGEWAWIEPDEFEELERAMNYWLELYASCYGVNLESDFTIRKAAELLIETRNIHDVAQLLTHVPSRH